MWNVVISCFPKSGSIIIRGPERPILFLAIPYLFAILYYGITFRPTSVLGSRCPETQLPARFAVLCGKKTARMKKQFPRNGTGLCQGIKRPLPFFLWGNRGKTPAWKTRREFFTLPR